MYDLGVIYIDELCKFLPPNRGPLAKILIFLLVWIIVSKGYLHVISWLVALRCIFCFWIMRKLEPRVDWVREVTRKGRRGNNSQAIFLLQNVLIPLCYIKPASGIQNGYPKNSRNLIGNYWCTVLLANGFWRDEFVYQTLRQPTQSILASSLSTISSRMDPWLLNLVLCKCTITYPSVKSEVGRISCKGKSLLKFFHVMTFYGNSNNNLYLLHTYLHSQQ